MTLKGSNRDTIRVITNYKFPWMGSFAAKTCTKIPRYRSECELQTPTSRTNLQQLVCYCSRTKKSDSRGGMCLRLNLEARRTTAICHGLQSSGCFLPSNSATCQTGHVTVTNLHWSQCKYLCAPPATHHKYSPPPQPAAMFWTASDGMTRPEAVLNTDQFRLRLRSEWLRIRPTKNDSALWSHCVQPRQCTYLVYIWKCITLLKMEIGSMFH